MKSLSMNLDLDLDSIHAEILSLISAQYGNWGGGNDDKEKSLEKACQLIRAYGNHPTSDYLQRSLQLQELIGTVTFPFSIKGGESFHYSSKGKSRIPLESIFRLLLEIYSVDSSPNLQLTRLSLKNLLELPEQNFDLQAMIHLFELVFETVKLIQSNFNGKKQKKSQRKFQTATLKKDRLSNFRFLEMIYSKLQQKTQSICRACALSGWCEVNTDSEMANVVTLIGLIMDQLQETLQLCELLHGNTQELLVIRFNNWTLTLHHVLHSVPLTVVLSQAYSIVSETIYDKMRTVVENNRMTMFMEKLFCFYKTKGSVIDSFGFNLDCRDFDVILDVLTSSIDPILNEHMSKQDSVTEKLSIYSILTSLLDGVDEQQEYVTYMVETFNLFSRIHQINDDLSENLNCMYEVQPEKRERFVFFFIIWYFERSINFATHTTKCNCNYFIGGAQETTEKTCLTSTIISEAGNNDDEIMFLETEDEHKSNEINSGPDKQIELIGRTPEENKNNCICAEVPFLFKPVWKSSKYLVGSSCFEHILSPKLAFVKAVFYHIFDIMIKYRKCYSQVMPLCQMTKDAPPKTKCITVSSVSGDTGACNSDIKSFHLMKMVGSNATLQVTASKKRKRITSTGPDYSKYKSNVGDKNMCNVDEKTLHMLRKMGRESLLLVSTIIDEFPGYFTRNKDTVLDLYDTVYSRKESFNLRIRFDRELDFIMAKIACVDQTFYKRYINCLKAMISEECALALGASCDFAIHSLANMLVLQRHVAHDVSKAAVDVLLGFFTKNIKTETSRTSYKSCFNVQEFARKRRLYLCLTSFFKELAFCPSIKTPPNGLPTGIQHFKTQIDRLGKALWCHLGTFIVPQGENKLRFCIETAIEINEPFPELVTCIVSMHMHIFSDPESRQILGSIMTSMFNDLILSERNFQCYLGLDFEQKSESTLNRIGVGNSEQALDSDSVNSPCSQFRVATITSMYDVLIEYLHLHDNDKENDEKNSSVKQLSQLSLAANVRGTIKALNWNTCDERFEKSKSPKSLLQVCTTIPDSPFVHVSIQSAIRVLWQYIKGTVSAAAAKYTLEVLDYTITDSHRYHKLEHLGRTQGQASTCERLCNDPGFDYILHSATPDDVAKLVVVLTRLLLLPSDRRDNVQNHSLTSNVATLLEAFRNKAEANPDEKSVSIMEGFQIREKALYLLKLVLTWAQQSDLYRKNLQEAIALDFEMDVEIKRCQYHQVKKKHICEQGSHAHLFRFLAIPVASRFETEVKEGLPVTLLMSYISVLEQLLLFPKPSSNKTKTKTSSTEKSTSICTCTCHSIIRGILTNIVSRCHFVSGKTVKRILQLLFSAELGLGHMKENIEMANHIIKSYVLEVGKENLEQNVAIFGNNSNSLQICSTTESRNASLKEALKVMLLLSQNESLEFSSSNFGVICESVSNLLQVVTFKDMNSSCTVKLRSILLSVYDKSRSVLKSMSNVTITGSLKKVLDKRFKGGINGVTIRSKWSNLITVITIIRKMLNLYQRGIVKKDFLVPLMGTVERFESELHTALNNLINTDIHTPSHENDGTRKGNLNIIPASVVAVIISALKGEPNITLGACNKVEKQATESDDDIELEFDFGAKSNGYTRTGTDKETTGFNRGWQFENLCSQFSFSGKKPRKSIRKKRSSNAYINTVLSEEGRKDKDNYEDLEDFIVCEQGDCYFA